MSRKAKPVPKRKPQAPQAEPAPPAGLGDWTTRLADLVLHGAADQRGTAALHQLWAEHATGDPSVDASRMALLGHLGQRLALATRHPLAPAPSPLPAWPDADLSPLPQLHASGLAGTSLVALCQDETGLLLDSLPAWLASDAAEVVLVELGATPRLAGLIQARWPRPDRRLRLVEIAAPEVTAPQAWNAGLRLTRHQRLICLCPGARLPDGLADRLARTPGRFGLNHGPANGRRFVLDADRADLAASGGFNEYLPGMDFALDDLAARLMARGVTPWLPQAPALPDSPPQPALGGTLRQALAAHPALQALQNRHIAALMPDWRPAQGRAFAFAGQGALGPRLAPTADAPPALPAAIRRAAETRALSDLVSARLGQPVLLSEGPLELILSRPLADVCPLDLALADSDFADAVESRRAWLVIDIAPGALPLPGTRAEAAFRWLFDQAALHELYPVLRLQGSQPATQDDPLPPLPRIPADPALTQGFWPASFGDLAQDHAAPLPHATLRFDQGFLDNHAQFLLRGPAIFLRRPKLFVDAQHGLGNRLRAMASAAAIAQATGRELITIWQPDAHCDCLYEDLFTRDGAVLSEGFAPEAAAMGMDLFNYMQVEPGALKDQPIALNATRDAYVRSAYPLVHPASTWDSEHHALRRLVPNEVVRSLVAQLGPARPDLAVHIRMEGGRAAEHLAYEAPTNWTAEAHRDIDHWRKRSHYSFFLPRIDQLVAEGRANAIFLATDTPEVYDLLAQRYGARVRRLKRPASDRSAIAMVHALADAILLSRAPRLLGSSWSSFSELAARLALQPIEVELSGRDF